MGDPKLISEEPMSMLELREELKSIKKRDEELSFRASKMEDYLNSFVTNEKKEAEKIQKEIEELEVPRLRDLHIKKILDLMPSTMEQLKLVLDGYSLTVKQSNMKKILKVLKSHQ